VVQDGEDIEDTAKAPAPQAQAQAPVKDEPTKAAAK
jgi:hypothetical protein